MYAAIAYSFALFVFVMFAVSYFTYKHWAKPVRIQDRLGNAAVAPTLEQIGEGEKKFVVRVIQQVGEKATSMANPADATVAKRQLVAAGYRTEAALKIYYGMKVIMSGALAIFAFTFRTNVSTGLKGWIFVAVAIFAGYMLPNFFVEKVMKRRHEKLRFALPDALDLMVVCMEAGLGLDQTIANVSRELATTHPAIAEEMGLVNLEMRHGKRRSDALRNLGDRTMQPDLKKLVSTMIQSDKFGSSIAETLRTHSEFLRTRRRQEAEERAAKVGVKLVFPIFFFILPSMLVVAAGPGVLALWKHLFPMMKNMQ